MLDAFAATIAPGGSGVFISSMAGTLGHRIPTWSADWVKCRPPLCSIYPNSRMTQ